MIERRIRRLKEVKLLGRLNRREKPTSTKWWSDPPKLIPIIISVIALLISFLSLWVSNQGVRINAEINRPILSLTSLNFINSDVSVDKNFPPVSLNISYQLKNTGKSSATLREVEVRPFFLTDDAAECQKNANGVREDLYEKLILPTEGAFSSTKLVFPIECQQLQRWDFYLALDVTYTDVGSGLSYNQFFMESVNLTPETFKFGIMKVLPKSTPSPELVSSPTPTATPKRKS